VDTDNDKKTLDYGGVLADLEAKRAAIDQAIASLKVAAASGALAAVAGDSLPSMVGSVAVGLHGGDIPVGAFLRKSIPEAAKLCLQIVKRKMTTREITDALKKGGIETTAKTSFPAIVHSVLRRASRSGSGIVKLNRSHWGLADWYPASMRASTPTKPSGKKRRRANRTSRTRPRRESKTESIPWKVWKAINKPGVELSPQEVADQAGTKSNVAAMLLARLVKLGNAQKTANGKYRAAKTAG